MTESVRFEIRRLACQLKTALQMPATYPAPDGGQDAAIFNLTLQLGGYVDLSRYFAAGPACSPMCRVLDEIIDEEGS